MVQAVINIEENTNQILNIVKAKFGLKDKSQAIDMVVTEYQDAFLESNLRPAYKTKLNKTMQGKHLSRKQLDESLR